MTLKSSSSRLAVIGSSSMVGSRFCEQWPDPDNLIKADLNGNPSVDITSLESVSRFFQDNDFSTAILFSAFTDVDGAEEQRNDKKGICWKINVDGVKNIVQACKEHDRNLVFISTDFVFDGQNGPYDETAPVGPNMEYVSWYGISKIEAEKRVASALKDFIILRISYPYRAHFEGKDDFFKKILNLYKENKLYPMFDDQIMTPTFIDNLAPAVETILKSGQTGIFHIASPTQTTPYKITRKLIEVTGGDPNITQKGSIIDFLRGEGKTPRPVKGGLKVDRIEKLGFSPTPWEEGIDEIYQQSKGEPIE